MVIAQASQRPFVIRKRTGARARDPLTRPAPAEESAGAGHPLPQGGEGWKLHKARKISAQM